MNRRVGLVSSSCTSLLLLYLQVPVREGIGMTVEYFRNELEVAKRSQNISDIHIDPIRI